MTSFLLLICLVFAACPPKKPVKKVPRPPHERPAEVSRPASAPEADTPQRRASDRLVQKGMGELGAKNYEGALQAFQEAVNIDATNGAAYYYLALTNDYLGEKETAMGLLDKAESLLGHDSSWLEKIDDLREKIGGGKTPGTPLPPIMDEY
jgi:Tfp pilus assembly protein PilF